MREEREGPIRARGTLRYNGRHDAWREGTIQERERGVQGHVSCERQRGKPMKRGEKLTNNQPEKDAPFLTIVRGSLLASGRSWVAPFAVAPLICPPYLTLWRH